MGLARWEGGANQKKGKKIKMTREKLHEILLALGYYHKSDLYYVKRINKKFETHIWFKDFEKDVVLFRATVIETCAYYSINDIFLLKNAWTILYMHLEIIKEESKYVYSDNCFNNSIDNFNY